MNGGPREVVRGLVLVLFAALAAVVLYGLRHPGDAMAASLDNVVSPFWWLVGAVCRLVDPTRACGFLFLVGRVLLTVGLAALVACPRASSDCTAKALPMRS